MVKKMNKKEKEGKQNHPELSSLLEQYDEKIRGLLVEMDAYIKNNPQKSAFIGLGIGLVFSMMIKSIFKRKRS